MKKRLGILMVIFLLSLLATACTKVTVDSIRVITLPNKVIYNIGEELNLSGGEIKVSFSDGTDDVISMQSSAVEVSGFNSQTENPNLELKVKYNGKETQFYVAIVNPATSIEIKDNPDKTVYTIGDEVDLSGGVISVNYLDGTSGEIELITDGQLTQGVSVSELPNQLGAGILTITYKGASTTIDIMVNPIRQVQEVSLLTPFKTIYDLEEQLDLTGGVLRVVYNDTTEEEVSLLNQSGKLTEGVEIGFFSPYNAGIFELEITYKGITITVEVTVFPSSLNDLFSKTLEAVYEGVFLWYEINIDYTVFHLMYRQITAQIDDLLANGSEEMIKLYNEHLFFEQGAEEGWPLSEWYAELNEYREMFIDRAYCEQSFILFDDYLDVVEKYISNAEYRAGNTAFDQEVKALYDGFVGLLDNADVFAQFDFITLVHYQYIVSVPFFSMDTFFNRIMLEYFENSLPNNKTVELYQLIRYAGEHYMAFNLSSVYLSNFINRINTLNGALDNIGDDYDIFRQYFGDEYDKYMNKFSEVSGDSLPEPLRPIYQYILKIQPEANKVIAYEGNTDCIPFLYYYYKMEDLIKDVLATYAEDDPIVIAYKEQKIAGRTLEKWYQSFGYAGDPDIYNFPPYKALFLATAGFALNDPSYVELLKGYLSIVEMYLFDLEGNYIPGENAQFDQEIIDYLIRIHTIDATPKQSPYYPEYHQFWILREIEYTYQTNGKSLWLYDTAHNHFNKLLNAYFNFYTLTEQESLTNYYLRFAIDAYDSRRGADAQFRLFMSLAIENYALIDDTTNFDTYFGKLYQTFKALYDKDKFFTLFIGSWQVELGDNTYLVRVFSGQLSITLNEQELSIIEVEFDNGTIEVVCDSATLRLEYNFDALTLELVYDDGEITQGNLDKQMNVEERFFNAFSGVWQSDEILLGYGYILYISQTNFAVMGTIEGFVGQFAVKSVLIGEDTLDIIYETDTDDATMSFIYDIDLLTLEMINDGFDPIEGGTFSKTGEFNPENIESMSPIIRELFLKLYFADKIRASFTFAVFNDYTDFMVYFYDIMDILNQIEDSDDETLINELSVAVFDGKTYQDYLVYILYYGVGAALPDGLLQNDDFMYSYDLYIEIVRKYMLNPYALLSDEDMTLDPQFESDVTALMNSFLVLDSQFRLEFYYMMFSQYTGAIAFWSYDNYYNRLLNALGGLLETDAEYELYQNLRRVEEAYILYTLGYATQGMLAEQVISMMEKYEALTDPADFDRIFGVAYTWYLTMYQTIITQ